ncbi:MAG: alpha/beta hydrolase [Desulfobacterales bacterium]|nr:alpha/beta hydrolase [Desulfobacterales bacterium]
MQMIAWEIDFCKALAERGNYVIRFDNRDVGHTTWCSEAGIPDLGELMQSALEGKPVKPPYTLKDMAADTVGLLDGLEIEKAHVAGVSMGGMIAQTMAIDYPQRISSLTSIMSTTGNPALPGPAPEAQQVLLAPPPAEREAYIESRVELWQILSGPGAQIDLEHIRRREGMFYDRGMNPSAPIRQLAAIMASGNRRPMLEKVNIPALVIHGDIDPLLPMAYGEDTADAIPGAKLKIIKGMGHNLDTLPQVWEEVIGAIQEHIE